eukprot:4082517-Karenia_brevis.AAC.1
MDIANLMRNRLSEFPTSSCVRMAVVLQSGDDDVLKYKFVHDQAKPLQRKSKHAAGWDIASVENVTIKAHGQSMLKTGLVLAAPPDTY